MIVFYTGANTPNGVQNVASKSLGGYISQTIVPNGMINNIFSNLSSKDIIDKKEQIRCIVLKNVLPTDQNNIKIWVETQDTKYSIKLGIVEELFLDENCNAYYLEEIQNNEQLPYYVEFEDRTGENKAYIKNNLIKGGYLGIWLKREALEEVEVEYPNTGGVLTECDKEFFRLESSGESELMDLKLIVEWGGVVTQQKIEWGYTTTDPLGNEEGLVPQFSSFLQQNQTSLNLDFTSAGSNKFIYYKVPTGLIPNMVTWNLDEYNKGVIPDQVFRQVITINGYDYCLSRNEVLMNTDTIVEFRS